MTGPARHGVRGSAARLVDDQPPACNARGLEASIACFTASARVWSEVSLMARDHAGPREPHAYQFAALPVHAAVLRRGVLAAWAVDEERLTGTGEVPLRAVVAYRVRDGLIDEPRLLATAPEPPDTLEVAGGPAS